MVFYICERLNFVPDFMCEMHETNMFVAFNNDKAIVLPNIAKIIRLTNKKWFTVIIKISESKFVWKYGLLFLE